MADPAILDELEPRVRRDIEALAEDRGVPAAALVPEIIAAYVRLLRDAPGALPRNPLEPVVAGARRRAAR